MDLSTLGTFGLEPVISGKVSGCSPLRHGTLAVAHVLKERGQVKAGDKVDFETLSGILKALINDSTVALDFPSPAIEFGVSPSSDLLEHLGITTSNVISFGYFDSKVFIEVDCEKTLRNLRPNFEALKQINGRGVLITACSVSVELDFVSRYFVLWVELRVYDAVE
ncbi:PhzF family phenazine biosynthesis protein [Vibrio tapetis subsp. quintayensis]|uniref:PhzF family phenazine biosynthesis protein n=1 Tax=Vibrio tapetis TaxID=52443 RepID=UPI0025B5914E|nr:PhzF family phenazine biosynthesis protein [Vibrio tapetis]MDN3678816.1 PhzF family phenazine biosynthesis protein [Vibrio tapetis subsp. quintayensis]